MPGNSFSPAWSFRIRLRRSSALIGWTRYSARRSSPMVWAAITELPAYTPRWGGSPAAFGDYSSGRMRIELHRPLASLGIAALLLLAAVTVPAAGGLSPTPPASSGAGSGPSDHPAGLEAVSCAGGAPSGARCDTLWVPLDYADPSRGTIATSVIVIPAKDPPARIGSLLVNPGGPGRIRCPVRRGGVSAVRGPQPALRHRGLRSAGDHRAGRHRLRGHRRAGSRGRARSPGGGLPHRRGRPGGEHPGVRRLLPAPQRLAAPLRRHRQRRPRHGRAPCGSG